MKSTITLLAALLFFLAQTDRFTFRKGTQKIVLTIDDGRSNLKWGKSSKMTLRIENITRSDIMLVAPGLKRSEGHEDADEFKFDLKPDKNHITGNTLKLLIGFKTPEKERVQHSFKIPIVE